MSSKQSSIARILLIAFIVMSLSYSVFLSAQSVTGYIVADTVDGVKNMSALILFLSGLFASIFYLARFR
ncbi:MAG: hypothetical protein ACP5NS_02325 [Candidatus Pacearchaeota archaeon]